ncbi:INCE protein [Balamuthia mandrillaris]
MKGKASRYPYSAPAGASASDAAYTTGWHEVVIGLFKQLLLDLPCLPLLLLLAVTAWRLPFLLPRLRSSKTDVERRGAILRETGWLLCDVLALPGILLAALTLVCLPGLYRELKYSLQDNNPNWRWKPLLLLYFFLQDVLWLVFATLLLVFPWRWVQLLLRLRAVDRRFRAKEKEENYVVTSSPKAREGEGATVKRPLFKVEIPKSSLKEVERAGARQDFYDRKEKESRMRSTKNGVLLRQWHFVLLDLECFFFILLHFLLGWWRLPGLFWYLWNKQHMSWPYTSVSYTAEPWHLIVCEQSERLFLDWLHLPLFLFVVVFSFWRAPAMMKNIHSGVNDCFRREAVIRAAAKGWLDLMMALMLVLTFWRAPTTFRLLRAAENDDQKGRELEAAAIKGWLDFLSIVVMLLFFWRAPSLLRSLRSSVFNSQRSEAIKETAAKGLLDVLCVIVIVLLVVTLYRLPSLVRAFRAREKGSEETWHEVVFRQLKTEEMLRREEEARRQRALLQEQQQQEHEEEEEEENEAMFQSPTTPERRAARRTATTRQRRRKAISPSPRSSAKARTEARSYSSPDSPRRK